VVKWYLPAVYARVKLSFWSLAGCCEAETILGTTGVKIAAINIYAGVIRIG